MLLHYSILVRRASPAVIISIQVPDLKLSFENEALNNIEELGINEFSVSKITAHLNQLIIENKPIREPKKSYEFKEMKLSKHDSWVTLPPIELNLQKGCFEKMLPKVGGVAAVSSGLANVIISIVAMELAMSNLSDKELTRSLGIIQSVLTGLIGLVIYFYSQSGEGLATVGKKLDQIVTGKQSINLDQKPKSCMSSTKLIMMKAGLSVITVGDMVGSSLALYQQIESVGMDAKNANLALSGKFFDICKWIFVVAGSITGLSFVGSFMANLYSDYENYASAQSEKPNDKVEIVVDDSEVSQNSILSDNHVRSDEVIEEDNIELVVRSTSPKK